MIHSHVSENVGHCQWVGDVRFTAASQLPVMGLLGIVVGAPNLLDLQRR
jgi:hypothetical protein